MEQQKSIILYHHLGLGDHFICNGLVNYHAAQFEKIILPCKRHYLATVQCLYSDNDKISILPVDNEPHDIIEFSQQENLNIVQVGFDYLKTSSSSWYDSFYEQCNIPTDYRLSHFSLPHQIPNAHTLYNQIIKSPDYILVHNGSSESNQYPIDILQGRQEGSISNIIKILPNISSNLFDCSSRSSPNSICRPGTKPLGANA
jgi:hypothetical protein